MNKSLEGIVLRHQDYRDNDVILSVYTKENGLMSFVARGIKKAQSKNASSCALFCCSIFQFNDNGKAGMQSLRVAERRNMFFHIYDDLQTQACAQIICECFEKMALEQSENAYALLHQSLTYLNATKKPLVVLGLCMAKCNALCGISPHVDACVQCQRTDEIASISLIDGGFLCIHCMDPHRHPRLNEQQLRSFRLFHKADIDDFPILEEALESDYDSLRYILLMFEEYSGVHLRSVEFLENIVAL